MRQRGQTFRSILGALKLASEGKHVIYSCPSHELARWTFEKAFGVVRSYMEPDMHTRQLWFRIGGGSVKFTGPLSKEMAREMVCSKRHCLVKDHLGPNSLCGSLAPIFQDGPL